MSNLVIDIGNTRTKWAVFKNNTWVDSGWISDEDVQFSFESFIQKYEVTQGIYASVRIQNPEWLNHLQHQIKMLAFNVHMNNGVRNQYQTPNTLGLDRWASVLAAHSKFASQNCLIIDAGTCITYDILTQDSKYLGGIISPGIQMRLKAMHHFTGKLPLVEEEFPSEIPSFGVDTRSAIALGAYKGAISEIIGLYQEYQDKYTELKMILTGGDASFLFHTLKNSIFANRISYEPRLVLEGIHSVLH